MRRALMILSVVFFVAVVMWFARGMSSGTNLDKREKYWEKELAGGFKAGSTKDELQAFAQKHGETVRCYQNGNREDECAFTDPESYGGSSNIPLKLAVLFLMKNDKVVSWQFARIPATTD